MIISKKKYRLNKYLLVSRQYFPLFKEHASVTSGVLRFAKEQLYIIVNRADSCDSKVVNKHLCDIF